MVEQITRRILPARIGIEHVFVRTIIQRPVINALLSIPGMTRREEKKVLAVRQERRPAVGGMLARFKLRQPHRSSTRSAHSTQRIAVIRFVDDDIVLIPRSSAGVGSLRQNRDWAARYRNFL